MHKGSKHTAETLAKMSKAQRGSNNPFWGRKHTVEARSKMGRPRKGSKNSMWGKKHSPESRAKIGDANRKRSKETRERMSEAQRGKKHSKESRAKMGEAKKGPKNHNWGKKLPKEARAKMSEAARKRTGSKNHQWRGGISREPYTWEFSDELKEEVRRRDGYKCQLCDVPQDECKRALDVHHIDYDKKNSDPVNLMALCRSCNTRVNANRKHWKAYFRALALVREIGLPRTGTLPNLDEDGLAS